MPTATHQAIDSVEKKASGTHEAPATALSSTRTRMFFTSAGPTPLSPRLYEKPWSRWPLAPLQSLDRQGRVLYVGTFSKVLSPSLRLGFVIAPATLMPSLHQAKRLCDWHGAPEPQRALAALIGDGLFARHLRRLIRVYRERRDRLAAAIERAFGAEVEQLPSLAGLHFSVRFRRRLDVAALAGRARAAGVVVQPLAPYYERGAIAGLALGYGLVQAAHIDEGVRRLAAAHRAGERARR
jgi:GntR family transcriptional regulator/MocR family aminotransferase